MLSIFHSCWCPAVCDSKRGVEPSVLGCWLLVNASVTRTNTEIHSPPVTDACWINGRRTTDFKTEKNTVCILIMFIPQTIRYDWLEGPSQGSFIVFNHKELFGTKDLHSRIGLVWAKISTAPLNPWREFPARIFDIATNVLKWTVIYLCIHRCLYIGSLVFLLFFDKLLTFLWLYCFYNF